MCAVIKIKTFDFQKIILELLLRNWEIIHSFQAYLTNISPLETLLYSKVTVQTTEIIKNNNNKNKQVNFQRWNQLWNYIFFKFNQ